MNSLSAALTASLLLESITWSWKLTPSTRACSSPSPSPWIHYMELKVEGLLPESHPDHHPDLLWIHYMELKGATADGNLPDRAGIHESITWSWKIYNLKSRNGKYTPESITWSWKRVKQFIEQLSNPNFGRIHYMELKVWWFATMNSNRIGLWIHYMELKGGSIGSVLWSRRWESITWSWKGRLPEGLDFEVRGENPLHGVERSSGEHHMTVVVEVVGIHYMELKGSYATPSLKVLKRVRIHYMELKAVGLSMVFYVLNWESITWSWKLLCEDGCWRGTRLHVIHYMELKVPLAGLRATGPHLYESITWSWKLPMISPLSV